MTKGIQIKTFVVLDALGRIRAVKLNKKAAVEKLKNYPNGTIEFHMADKA